MAKKVRFKWRPEMVVHNIEDHVERMMHNVGNLIRNTVVRKLNKGQPVRRTKSGSLVGLNPSKPGEPPRTLTGRLKQSVSFTVQRTRRRIVLRVGTNVVYGRRLELGFFGRDKLGRNYNQAARPWLRPSVTENFKKIGELLKKGGK